MKKDSGKRRKRRKKKVYLQYDYEAAYTKALKQMEEANEERLLKEGLVRSLYATKEVKAGDRLDVEIYPVFQKGQEDQIPDEGKKERQRQAQRDMNDRNSRKACERLIEENFTDRDIWCTFTYTDETMPISGEVAKRNITNYIKRLNYRRKRLGLPLARYVYVTECSKRGRWHHHIVMSGDISMDEAEKLWTMGKRNQIRRLQRDEDGLTGMARYITKDKGEAGKYQKTWKASKGLRKPAEKVNHYKTRMRDVIQIVKGEKTVAQHLEKWYDAKGYEYAESEVRYNKFNGRFYIYARMRKKKDHQEKKPRKT